MPAEDVELGGLKIWQILRALPRGVGVMPPTTTVHKLKDFREIQKYLPKYPWAPDGLEYII